MAVAMVIVELDSPQSIVRHEAGGQPLLINRQQGWRQADETTRYIIGIEVTTADWGDREVFFGLLDQVEGDVSQVSAEGAYDTKGCHAAVADRDARATIPPRDGAVPRGDDHPRDGILNDIAANGSDHTQLPNPVFFTVIKATTWVNYASHNQRVS